MKKALLLLMALCFISSLVFAQEATQPVPASTTPGSELSGCIVDHTSVRLNRDNLDEFIITYTKDDALKPESIDSGYVIFANDRVYPLNEESNAKVVKFLKNADGKLRVKVNARQDNDALYLISIENQE